MMHRLASPAVFGRLMLRVQPLAAWGALLLFGFGLYFALFASPADYQQGETVRIMYVHVPAAVMAMMIYAVMGGASAAFLVWRHPVADLIARESAPIGAAFTLLCLVTGSLWGKPMWGAWWVWDARLTSVLVLFFLYIGYMALESSVEGSERGRKACAALALIGLVNLPVIRFSVEWWNTLHQPASAIRLSGSDIDPSMQLPLFLMAAAFTLFYAWVLILGIRTALLQQKARRRQLQGR